MAAVQIDHFSDVLCVWAYFSESRIAEVERNFRDTVAITYRFLPVFGDMAGKIATSWQSKGGYDAFADHTHHNAKPFPELHINAKVWRETRPASSLSPHLYLKAIELCEQEGDCPAGTFAKAVSKMRVAFFAHGHDIAQAETQQAIGDSEGANAERVRDFLKDGRAHAALSSDYKAAEVLGISGSPTLVLNQGRQKLYGNVGYRIIEANIQELLRGPKADEASWC